MNDIYSYLHHFTNCPHDFLRPSHRDNSDTGINSNALLMDLIRSIDPGTTDQVLIIDSADWKKYSSDQIISMHLAAWFFSKEKFRDGSVKVEDVKSFLFEDLVALSKFITAENWLSDEDRSEEFVRTALMRCGILPDGESIEDAIDRLDALSTLKRNNVLNKSTEAFNRILEIRKKMADEKAREAANSYGRE